MMPTSSNVCRPPLDAAWTRRDPRGENGQFAGTDSQRFTDRLVRLDCDCHRLQLNRYLADLAANLNGTECGQATAEFSPIRRSAPSSAEKDIGLRPVTSACADCCAAPSPTAGQVIVTPKNKCRSFMNLANLLVHVNRHNHPRSTHSTRYFSWIRPRM